MIAAHAYLPNLINQELLEGCINGDKYCQRTLYEHFAPKMFGICLRYASDFHSAEDILQEGFIKVFSKLHTYRYKGELQAWIKRIFINAAIEYYRKSMKFNHFTNIQEAATIASVSDSVSQYLAQQDLLKMIQSLPIGYRTVFNLYAIEGYSHKEISKMLNIKEGTSKSQLARGRLALQKMIKKAEILEKNHSF